VTPLAEYPKIINRWIARASKLAVSSQTTWLKRHIPEDVFKLLATAPKKSLPAREAYTEEERREFWKKVADLHIFGENPLAKYDPAHTWVDPNGYILSDRIWRTGEVTRQKIDAMLADGIRSGISSTKLAKMVEPFLLPNRLGVRTTRPYGRDASFDAMRLARTEISRAHSQASYAAALTNPYVGGMDWALSLSHPKIDICDKYATIGMNGDRIREPYLLDSAALPPAHPHCLCNTRPAIKEDVASVTAKLRAAFEEAQRLEIQPSPNPANTNEFLYQLLGKVLFEAIG
jgi:hypothetical protein